MITKSDIKQITHWTYALLSDSLAVVLNCVMALTFFLKWEWKKNRRGTPILLVHGYFNNNSSWAFHGKLWERSGFGPIYTVNLGFSLASIKDYAKKVARKAAEIAKENNREDLILIGYSMGGLVSAYYAVEIAPQGSVRNVITIASPLKGTKTAKIAIGRCGGEMRLHSSLLTSLNEKIFYYREINFYHVAAKMDLFVRPYDSAILKNDPRKEYIVGNAGHAAMLYSRRVNQKISEWLSLINQNPQ